MTDQVSAKMLTPVAATPEEDQKAVALSYEDPQRMDHRKLFGPHSNWQFRKWNREDAVGFVINTVVLFVIVGMLYLLVNIGA